MFTDIHMGCTFFSGLVSKIVRGIFHELLVGDKFSTKLTSAFGKNLAEVFTIFTRKNSKACNHVGSGNSTRLLTGYSLTK
jgi:hypothetical protein